MLKSRLSKLFLSYGMVTILLLSYIGPVTVIADEVIVDEVIAEVDVYAGVPAEYHALLDTALAKAGDNRASLESALIRAVGEEKEGVAFLIAYMKDPDLLVLSGDFILSHVKPAYVARNRFPWGKEIPNEMFLNYVLPFESINETRVEWRDDFYNRFAPYVAEAQTLEEAYKIINRIVRAETGATFATAGEGRRVSNANPFETIDTGIASCSGLTVVLVNAFRAVGLPSRVSGNTAWFDNRGNHSWAHVWVDNEWKFTEYDPSQYGWNRAWFEHSSGRAILGDARWGIFATSYKPTETVWTNSAFGAHNPHPNLSPSRAGIRGPGNWVYANEVTQLYIDSYKAAVAEQKASPDYGVLRVIGYVDEFHQTPADRRQINFDVWEGPFGGGILVGQRSGGRTIADNGPVNTDPNEAFEVYMRKGRDLDIIFTHGPIRFNIPIESDEPFEVIIYSITKRALKDAIDEAEAKVEADYTEASWAALQTALNGTNAANARFNSTASTQAQVNTATNNLVNALENLVLKVPVTSIKIDALSIATVARYGTYSFNLILNGGEIDLTLDADKVDADIVWAIADPSLGYVDDAGNVTIFDKIGNVRLTATDLVSGISHSITLRIAS